MEPKIGENEIPTGWSLERVVKKDGSAILYYYCSDTGQHFFTYSDFIRYVEYAKRKKVGIYAPVRKAIKRKRKVENERRARQSRTASLSLRPKPKKQSDSTSFTVDKIDENASSSTLRESIDNEEDEDNDKPESDGDDGLADSELDDIADEVRRIIQEEMNDLSNR